MSEFGSCERCDEQATAYMFCKDGGYRDLCPAHEAEEERETASAQAFRAPARAFGAGRYHNCKDPCGAEDCIGFAAQVARDLRESR